MREGFGQAILIVGFASLLRDTTFAGKENELSNGPNETARAIFEPIAADYELWSRVLSFGQDPRWRKRMVGELAFPSGARVLDVAAGTGEVTRLLAKGGCRVISLDSSPWMLRRAARRGACAVLGRAEDLPFPEASFDGLTFTYLLRYVTDPLACMRELTRVVRPGGKVGMVEFGLPRGFWNPWWRFYTRAGLPVLGACIGHGWKEVGKFLGPSIRELHGRLPPEAWRNLWKDAGLAEIRMSSPSLGGGLIMWGVRS